MSAQPSITVNGLLDEITRRKSRRLPLEVLRLGDRQYNDLVDECEAMPGSHKWDEDEPPPKVEQFCGIRIERVESPDYFYVGER